MGNTLMACWLFIALCVSVLCAVFSIAAENNQEIKMRRIMNIKNSIKLLTKLWIFNFIIMTSLLWFGYYAEHQGMTWITTPRDVTLFSSGVVKIILTVALITAWINRNEEVDK